MVDAIVALTLASLAIVTVAAAYPFASRAKLRSAEHAEVVEDLRALELVGEIIRRARPIVAVVPDKAPEALFTGTASTMRMVSDFVGTTEVGGAYQVDLAIEETETGQVSVVLRRSVFRPRILDRKAERRLIARGLSEARFRYFGRSRPGEAGSWRETWQGRQALPELVAVDVELTRGGVGKRSIVIDMALRR